MSKYLGEKKINTKTHSIFKEYTPADWALHFVGSYGQIDGAHHKLWVLDQVARILNGTKVIVTEASWANGEKEYRFNLDKPSKEYKEWVDEMKGEKDENGDYEYGYDEGTPP